MSKSISLIFLVLSVVVATLAYPHPQNEEIVLYESEVGDKGYNFQFETSDGVARTETGKLVPDSEGGESLSVEGAYTFTDDKGEQHSVRFIADENGYRLVQ